MNTGIYPIHPAKHRPEFQAAWKGPVWGKTPVLEIDYFRPESSSHRPQTRAKLLYGLEGLYGLYRVKDRYVRCVHRRYQDPVYKDSCVEFFVQPCRDRGYFNFEFNCGGTMLASYVVDPKRTENGFTDFTRLRKDDVRHVKVFHTQAKIIEPEIPAPITWFIEFYIPYTLMEKYVGPLEIKPGTIWRGNLYKCADDTSHPHWASWRPVDALDFHLPACFGCFHFMPHQGSDGKLVHP